MSLFHSLRSSPWLAKLALLWFVLTLGVAVASPVVHPQEELVICSGMGMQKVVLNDDGSTSSSAVEGMSCPLCLMAMALPASTLPTLEQPRYLSHVLHSTITAQLVAIRAAPLPARGPPRI
jgi:hypothetical protein